MLPFRLPGLHSLHWKVFAFHLAVLILPVGYLGWQLRRGLEVTYLQATEEGMIDLASLVGGVYTRWAAETGVDPPALTRRFGDLLADLEAPDSAKARLFGFTADDADTRLVLYDEAGRVLYDSGQPGGRGRNESRRREVRLALAGRYGDRWAVEGTGPRRRLLISAAVPVWVRGRVAGVVCVVKPTGRVRRLLVRKLVDLFWPALGTVAVAGALAYGLSAYLTGIVHALASQASRVAAGESGVRLETWTRSELGTLARAVERMRRRLEGKAYVEEAVTNLSHELKTPLAAIRGAAELLEDGAAADPAARRRFLRNIQQETARLDALVDGLLQLARLEAAPAAAPEGVPPLDLTAAAGELVAVYRPRAEQFGLTLDWSAPAGPLTCRLPAAQFRQLAGSLLDNALQFTPSGRAVHVTLAREPGGTVRLTVRDEGQGIPPEFLPKIFDRFFTTIHPRTGVRGTGLGLALVRTIAQGARGTVAVRSQPGAGSTFVVRLPTADGVPALAPVPAPAAGPPAD